MRQNNAFKYHRRIGACKHGQGTAKRFAGQRYKPWEIDNFSGFGVVSMADGAKKRGKLEEASKYESLAERFHKENMT